jgi:hypothetical protein
LPKREGRFGIGSFGEAHRRRSKRIPSLSQLPSPSTPAAEISDLVC